MKYRQHDLPCIPVPARGQPELQALYKAREERERHGVDIDRIHHRRGLVAPHLRKRA